MSETKPWEVVDLNGMPGYKADEARIAMIAEFGYGFIVRPVDAIPDDVPSEEECSANARLLAAGRRMLESLHDAEAGLDQAISTGRGVCFCSGEGGGFVCTPHSALSSVRAAIAKAEGRS
jgi:hypothetical protein